MRPLPLMAAGLLAATLLARPTAHAAGETCQGQPATIVGTFLQQDLTGTEGPDVVVTNGATVVKTLGGDDLVCVTDEPGRRLGVRLDTGPGDDVVDGTFTLADIEAVLGSGSDTYSGSPARDQVVTGDGTVDNEQDIVSSGVGSSATNAGDQVESGSRGCPTPTCWSSVASAARSSGRVRWPREPASTWDRAARSCRTSERPTSRSTRHPGR